MTYDAIIYAKRQALGESPEEALARQFAANIRDAIGAEKWQEMKRRNATSDYTAACASHDFCDANQMLIDALEALTIPASFDFEHETRDHENACDLENRVWEIARARYL